MERLTPSDIPGKVWRWLESCQLARQEAADVRGVDLGKLVPPWLILTQIWNESAGKLGLEDYADSGHYGVLQIGSGMATYIDQHCETVDVPAAGAQYFSKRASASILGYIEAQYNYRELTAGDPYLQWTFWASGPGGVEDYRTYLGAHDVDHPSAQAFDVTAGKIFDGIVDYLLKCQRRAHVLYQKRWGPTG